MDTFTAVQDSLAAEITWDSVPAETKEKYDRGFIWESEVIAACPNAATSPARALAAKLNRALKDGVRIS